MQVDPQQLSESYRKLSDVEMAGLAAQADALTDAGRVALAAEIERRGLDAGRLAKLNASELRREAKFDRLESLRRKQRISWLLFRNEPWSLVVAFLAFLALVLIAELSSHRH